MTILTPFIILGALGILFALLLGFASKKFEVQVDRRVLKVREMLPGANCGACELQGAPLFTIAYASPSQPGNPQAPQFAPGNMLLKNSNTKVLWIVELTTIFKVEAKLVQTDVWVAEAV